VGENVELGQLFSSQEMEAIGAAFAKCGFGDSARVHQMLGGKHDYGVLRIYRAVQARSRGT